MQIPGSLRKGNIYINGMSSTPDEVTTSSPNMKKQEILNLTDDLKQRAVNMENGAKENLIELKGLGRNYAWADLINADKNQIKLFDDIDMFQTPCECVD